MGQRAPGRLGTCPGFSRVSMATPSPPPKSRHWDQTQSNQLKGPQQDQNPPQDHKDGALQPRDPPFWCLGSAGRGLLRGDGCGWGQGKCTGDMGRAECWHTRQPNHAQAQGLGQTLPGSVLVNVGTHTSQEAHVWPGRLGARALRPAQDPKHPTLILQGPTNRTPPPRSLPDLPRWSQNLG